MSAVIYPLNIHNPGDLRDAIESVGADPRAEAYFQPKRRVRHLLIKQADFRAAAFLKQELLARGGDAVVAKHVIDGRAELSDVLLVGTDGQLDALLKKMEAMDFWGLKELRSALGAAIASQRVSSWTMPLPGGRELSLDPATKVMGILNLTADSFYAPSRVRGSTYDMLKRAEAMLLDGADVLDVGAESTRPGAQPVSEEDELSRLIPAVEALRRAFADAVISVDTYKGKVALAAAEAGADIVNDVGGFGLDPNMLACAVQSGLPYVLSHIKGTPPDMNASTYDDLLSELHLYFQEKIEEAGRAGLPKERLILDPGLGFGKRMEENLLILKEIESLSVFGCPILVGCSRKRFTAAASVTGEVVSDDLARLWGTVSLSAVLEGRVQMVRVHDVRENKSAILMARAIREAR